MFFFFIYFLYFNQNHQSAWPFQKPVDKNEAPDYLDHIRFPMGESLSLFNQLN